MVYIIAVLIYFGLEDPYYTVYQGITFSNLENCQQYVEKHRPEMSHELWDTHRETWVEDQSHKLKNFRVMCTQDKPKPEWKEI